MTLLKEYATLTIDSVLSEHATLDSLTENAISIPDADTRPIRTPFRLTICLSDDSVLRDHEETTSEVSSLCSLERGVGKTLTRTVSV
jgi:hypothetical protein